MDMNDRSSHKKRVGSSKRMNGDVAESLRIVEEDSSGEDTSSSRAGLISSRMQDVEEDIQFEFKNEGVTYRVVQVTEENIPSSEAMSPAAFSGDTSPTPVQMLYTNSVNGGVYVVGAPHEMFPITTEQRTILPQLEENVKPVITRDDRRRRTHNEVERRRRDKINNWIMKLSKIIPECKQESSRGSFESQSKGGILAKACDYIIELRENNQQLISCVKEGEQLSSEVERLAREVEELKVENQQLKAILDQHGIATP